MDSRLLELVCSNLSFQVLFEKVLHSIYYAGPEIPSSVLHMMNIADVYNEVPLVERRPSKRIEFESKINIDSAALVTLPRSFLNELRLSSREFVRDFMKDDAVLVNVYDTFLGRIGIVLVPLEDNQVYVDRTHTLKALNQGVDLASKLGANTISLTGLLPSATNGGRDLAMSCESRLPNVKLTTGHGTTIASFVMMVEKILAESGRRLSGEDVTFLGLGSIGVGILKLVLALLPHPRRIQLCDLPVKLEALRLLAQELKDSGYKGDLDIIQVTGSGVPDSVYESTCLISATSVPNIVDINRIKSGTILIDDSAPHCFDPKNAVRRFQAKRDILFTEAGAIQSHRPISEIYDLTFSTGWDHRIRATLKLLHPEKGTIMGCVFSSILSSRFENAPGTLGTPSVEMASKHYSLLRELKFSGASLYCEDHILDSALIEIYRNNFSENFC